MTFQLTPLKPGVESIKVKANEAFVAKKFDTAVRLYTQAIAAQPDAEVLYSNRSAASLAKGDTTAALKDANKAIELAPGWSKAYSRRAAALAACGRTMGAIISMKRSLELQADAGNQTRLDSYAKALVTPKHASKPRRSIEAQSNLDTCADDVAFAFAQGRGINLSANPTATAAKNAIIRHAQAHPDWDAPVRRALYLPSPDERDKNSRQLAFDPARGQLMQPESIFKCKAFDSEFLYHEDGAEKLRGNPNGVGLGYLYRIWQVMMDDNANADRPANPEASKLLQRPNLHGPLLVMKTLHLKSSNEDLIVVRKDMISDVLAWEIVTMEELMSEEWQEKRTEFVELLKRSSNKKVAQYLDNSQNSFLIIQPPRRA